MQQTTFLFVVFGRHWKKKVTIDKILSRVLCAGQPTAGGAVCLLCWLILCGLTLVSFDLSSVILSISTFRGLTLSYFSCLAASANLVLLCCWSNINLFVLCLNNYQYLLKILKNCYIAKIWLIYVILGIIHLCFTYFCYWFAIFLTWAINHWNSLYSKVNQKSGRSVLWAWMVADSSWLEKLFFLLLVGSVSSQVGSCWFNLWLNPQISAGRLIRFSELRLW